ncbi:cardiolipin synthase [Luteolibacter algae]|uniref:Cardiolipin synthase n=1 Tax=Luteolibacter algae TaxID=454151 RepID=A0ABW5D3L3_9BACT
MENHSASDSEPDSHKKKKFNRIRVFYRLYRKRLIAGFVVLAHVAGALTSVEAVMETRTPPGAVAWAISLNLFPYGAVPAYWIFGHTEFESYQAASLLNEAEFEPIRQDLTSSLAKQGLRDIPDTPLEKMLESLTPLSFTYGNKVDLLVDGRETFDAMYAAIDSAQKYILLQSYIIRDDATGRRFSEKLIAKAKAGVMVKVLYDEIGSLGLGSEFTGRLLASGVDVKAFSTNQSDGRKFQLNFRNHRKIMVVDGKIGFSGGLNIGDEYLGKHDELSPWRDTHMSVSGPTAMLLQLPFAEDWYWVTEEVLDGLDWELKPPAEDADATVLCLPTGPADIRETCGLFFLAAINSAKERLWIATPYFVPDEQILSALKLAVLRGVDVRIIVPGMNDSTLVKFSSYAYLDEVKKAGVRAYRFGNGFLHQKTMLIDDDFSCVGSANMDNRSFRLNFEIVLAVKSEDFGNDMEKMFEKDFADSTEFNEKDLDEKSFPFRLSSRVSRLLAPIQ